MRRRTERLGEWLVELCSGVKAGVAEPLWLLLLVVVVEWLLSASEALRLRCDAADIVLWVDWLVYCYSALGVEDYDST